ncbi:MAG: zinc ribbon domain-containing protein [Hoeflea sp.]|nr:zinc ribbon domain-containing protein [Hoeflea sp.]
MIIQTDIPKGDLVALLERSGLPAPFNLRPEGHASPLSETLIASLSQAGLVEPGKQTIEPSAAGRIVADVLLSPRCHVQLVLWNDEIEGRVAAAFPASPAAGTGVIVNQSADTVHLQGFVDDQALIELITPVVSVLPETTASFDATLSFTQASVLAALLDMIVSDRRERPGSRRIRPLSPTTISEWLEILWAGGPRTSISGQVFSLALSPDPPNMRDVASVLADLATGGLLIGQDEAGSYLPASALLDLAEVLDLIDGGFDLERVDRTEEGPPAGRVLHVMCGPAGAYILELTGADRLHIQLADRAATISTVAKILVGELAATQSEPAETVQVPPQAAVRNRFCTHCGKPIDPSWRFCIACGTAIGGDSP